MTAMMASGLVLDVILVAMACEGVALVLLFRLRRRGVPPAGLLPNLAAGMCLLLAMRLAIGGAWWGWLSACLLAALAGHAADLRRQWR